MRRGAVEFVAARCAARRAGARDAPGRAPARETQPGSFSPRGEEGATPPFYTPPGEEVAPPFYAPPLPPRDPFWGYHDLLIFLGAAPIALLLGAFLVKAIFTVLHFQAHGH